MRVNDDGSTMYREGASPESLIARLGRLRH
jgi:hypothetical protein